MEQTDTPTSEPANTTQRIIEAVRLGLGYIRFNPVTEINLAKAITDAGLANLESQLAAAEAERDGFEACARDSDALVRKLEAERGEARAVVVEMLEYVRLLDQRYWRARFKRLATTKEEKLLILKGWGPASSSHIKTAERLANDNLRTQLEEAKGRNKQLDENLAKKNRELDALHYVWCSGGCDGGVHRYSEKELTAEIVASAVRNTDRLVQWWVNYAGRKQYGPGGYKGDREGLEAAWNTASEKVTTCQIADLRADNERLKAELAALRKAVIQADRHAAMCRVWGGVKGWQYIPCAAFRIQKIGEALRLALAGPGGEKGEG